MKITFKHVAIKQRSATFQQIFAQKWLQFMCLHGILHLLHKHTHIWSCSAQAWSCLMIRITKMLSWLLSRSMIPVITTAEPGDWILLTPRSLEIPFYNFLIFCLVKWLDLVSKNKSGLAWHDCSMQLCVHSLPPQNCRNTRHIDPLLCLTVFIFTTVPSPYLSWTCKTPSPSTNHTHKDCRPKSCPTMSECPMLWQWILQAST